MSFTVINRCPFTIWPGFHAIKLSPLPHNGGWELASGKSTSFNVPRDLTSARVWARTGCSRSGSTFSCDTGDCGPTVECQGRTGRPPASLAEFTLNGAGQKDYYDVSLVDGFSLPISIHPKNPNSREGGNYWCKNIDCTNNLNDACPNELKSYNKNGQVVGCLTACEKFREDRYCCRGEFNRPETCKPQTWPSNYAEFFKKQCPTSYSFAYDDGTSTFFCSNTGYEIIFCG